ncbi:MAG TPA: hypothetical protein VIJ18_13605 [Microbacteriaceae bacterium]
MTVKRIHAVAAIGTLALPGIGFTARLLHARSAHAEELACVVTCREAPEPADSKAAWVSDHGSTTPRYWAGSFNMPTTPGDTYSWVSKNDTFPN